MSSDPSRAKQRIATFDLTSRQREAPSLPKISARNGLLTCSHDATSSRAESTQPERPAVTNPSPANWWRRGCTSGGARFARLIFGRLGASRWRPLSRMLRFFVSRGWGSLGHTRLGIGRLRRVLRDQLAAAWSRVKLYSRHIPM